MFTTDELDQAIRDRQARYHHQAYDAGLVHASRKHSRPRPLRRWLGAAGRATT